MVENDGKGKAKRRSGYPYPERRPLKILRYIKLILKKQPVHKEFYSGKDNDLFSLTAFPCFARFILREIEYGLKLRIKGYGGIECASGRLLKSFDKSGFTFVKQVCQLPVGKFLAGHAAEYGQGAIRVLAFGYFGIEYHGLPATGQVAPARRPPPSI